ncbi:ATP-dependent protease La (LON) substrate-binding domain-containing protein [Nannocystis exedens]|uniref:ATP-dependent protease La (LON) substrate-binding domain-containing protein n=1 Tax=Nannocystis exedens TaxID=54 RepID=A0A1I2AGZ8_9BACT|nr:LON peptidase substrate-binding domain-containing protein [Nannocystis exedens]PCC69827.1 peptidase S16 [Nannocystis exedens]SFE43059.1 ATP-dependent protease La (LON) substrate-binding domain-containing protein [Nannocystis exedens]
MLTARSTPLPEVLAALPIFPLPNVVLLPGMVLPLNVFEPRYLQLVDHALNEGQHIGVPLLRPRGERTVDRRPAFEPVFGLGKLVFHLRLPDGRRLIRLEGLGRVQLVRELPMTNLFRQVEAVALPEPPVYDKSTLLLLRSQIERLARLSGDDGDALSSLLALPDPRILLYALTAFLPSLELMGGHDVASAAARRQLVDLQQQSLAAETPEDRLSFLVDRTAALLRRLGETTEASILLN